MRFFRNRKKWAWFPVNRNRNRKYKIGGFKPKYWLKSMSEGIFCFEMALFCIKRANMMGSPDSNPFLQFFLLHIFFICVKNGSIWTSARREMGSSKFSAHRYLNKCILGTTRPFSGFFSSTVSLVIHQKIGRPRRRKLVCARACVRARAFVGM